MKRLLLVSLAFVTVFTAYSQKAAVPKHLLNKSVKVEYQKPIRDLSDFTMPVNPTVKAGAVAPTEEIIGTTFYDLWSNAAYGNRMYRYDDGTMVGTWTMGFTPTAFTDRGTGYNVFNGSEWGADPTARIEPVRTGWPSYAPWGENGEIVFAHNGSNLQITRRPAKFTGEWESFTYAGIVQPTWPKIVTSGETNQYTHVVYHSYNAHPNGMGGALIYGRSADGGTTFDPADVILDGMGPDYYAEFQSEEFVLASRGDVVAIFVMGAWADMFVMKSEDNGDTWEKIMVRENPYPFFTFETTLCDTFFTSDNSGSVAIDASGKVHVVFGINRVMHVDLTTTYNYFPYVDGIGYWNEDMPAFTNDLNALAPPQYGYAASELVEDVNYIGWMQDVNENGVYDLIADPLAYRSIGPSTMPTITIDDNGQIFVAYASVTEGYDNFTYNFKKIWARGYANGSWGPFSHVTADIIHIFDESIYPHFMQSSDADNVHLVYNNDGTPGMALDDEHDYQENRITYAAIPKSDVLTGVIDNSSQLTEQSVSQNYPNPFSNTSMVTVQLDKPANLSLVVTSLIGQEVMSINNGNVQAGTHFFRIDGSDLKAGVYFYTVKADNSSVTRKMIVQ